MGLRNRQTREELTGWTDEQYADFLDDVAEYGLPKACDDRVMTQGAMVRWIAASEARIADYGRALMVRAELAVHEGREIVDGATPDDVGVAKLRVNYRQWEASKWNRERYGERVKVESASAPTPDAGLIGFASELLRLVASRGPERVVEALPAVEEVRI